ncbi:MAG: glutathione binding-like protein [Burkholderiales bacterium]|nr:glutathione S-transferase N-terminal domain-containing protein [Burkholderiales bacterium]
MIELYYWPTPNGHKITMFLEETRLSYEIMPINIGRGDQFKADFLDIAPNNRMPAIIDRAPADGGEAISIFESGAILLYLAEKTGRFLPRETRERAEVLQWLFWQVGGLGPMAGQNHHFVQYAQEKIPYAIDRYVAETARLYAVLDRRLEDREFIAGALSIADIACYPWIVPNQKQRLDLADFPNVQRWFADIKARPATQRAYDKGKTVSEAPVVDESSRGILFGQSAKTIKR